jgi:hypothetical protein
MALSQSFMGCIAQGMLDIVPDNSNPIHMSDRLSTKHLDGPRGIPGNPANTLHAIAPSDSATVAARGFIMTSASFLPLQTQHLCQEAL